MNRRLVLIAWMHICYYGRMLRIKFMDFISRHLFDVPFAHSNILLPHAIDLGFFRAHWNFGEKEVLR